jgi:glycosyltransferase involved in cell wall biosynthesis
MFTLGLGEILATFVAGRTVLISENTRRWLPWVKTVIPCGVDTELFHPAEDGGKEPVPTILFVGTYGQRKRGKLLMDVFAHQIRPEVPDARLWMVCTDAPSAPGVEVLGRLSDAELADRYRRAWAFCLPSTYEGFGVPYIEALASGTPVVATPNPGAIEVLDNGRYGRIVAEAQLGTELTSLLTDERARKTLATAGNARAKRFTWPQVVAKYERVYRELGVASANKPRHGTDR